jgi:hypothetical protein
MQDLIITTQGKDLITKLVASATKATFTRVVTSNKKYTNAQASNLTTIENIQQSKTVDSVYITSDTKLIEAYVKFDNTLVTSGYNIQTVGIYAQETGGSEILYAVSLADSNVDYMPPYDGHNPTAITFRLNVRVENNANVEITIDATGSASNEALQAVKDSLTTTINSVNTTITNNLNTEIKERKAETSTLTTKLTTETSERKGADTSLQANINKEATARANADTAINTKLDPVKTLIDTVFLGEIVKDNDKGGENNKYKPVYFGTVNHSHVGLGTAGNGNTTWHKEAVKVLYTRLKDKGYKGIAFLWGVFQPAQYQWVIGSMGISSDGTYSEDASGGYPTYCQFISLTYGGNTMYRFGMNAGTWYFETIPTTTQVNTLINDAKTALTTKIETNLPAPNLLSFGFLYNQRLSGNSSYCAQIAHICRWFWNYIITNYPERFYNEHYTNYDYTFYGYGGNNPFNRFRMTITGTVAVYYNQPKESRTIICGGTLEELGRLYTFYTSDNTRITYMSSYDATLHHEELATPYTSYTPT